MKKIISRGIIITFLFLALSFTNNAYASTSDYTYKELSDGTIALNGYSGSEINVIVPSTIDGKQVTRIYSGTFLNNSTIKTVTLPDGLEQIGSRSFNNCQNLTIVYVPESVTYIYYKSYENCPNLMYQMAGNMVELDDGTYIKAVNVTVSGTYNYDLANQVIELVNEERAENGLNALEYNAELTSAAMFRAVETSVYWAHTRPNTLSCSTVSTLISAENIGWSTYTSASAIMNAWMNSSGHRKNILGESYDSIGVGCYIVNGCTYWVQLFSSKSSSNTTQTTGTKENVTNEVTVATDQGFLSLYISGFSSQMNLEIGDTVSPGTVKIKNAGNSLYTVIEASDVTWVSSDTSVFTVDDNGVITVVGGGQATLTATLGESVLTYTITVESPLQSISIANSLTIYAGYTASLDIVYNPTNTTDSKTATWSSSNTSVAKVNSNGVVTGVSEGTAIITATVSGKTSTCVVTVKEPVEETIYFSKTVETIFVTQTTKVLEVVFEPGTDTIDDTITWSSSDSSIVTVDDNGVISVLSTGTVTITATTSSGNTATCQISVINYLKGDLDRDGDVDAVDAALALDFFKYGGETDEDLEIGDMDEDGDIDATDAALILDVFKYGN